MSFQQWWPCPKKHTKRIKHILPHARRLKDKLGAARSFRYFTLCGPPMIDIFMLAKEGILDYDAVRRAIETVVFCESDEEQVPVMRELVGRENSGFQGNLEDVVLFDDNKFTAPYPTIQSIENFINLKEESLPKDQRDWLQLKTDQLNLREFFPFDFINLDFCDPYYPQPPDIMKVSRTVARILEWQGRIRTDAKPKRLGRVDEFVMAVTCRLDDSLPQEAATRLVNIVRSNCDAYPNYRRQVAASRPAKIEDWAKAENLDFFLSGWPKDVAGHANDKQWNMDILDYVHYSRQNEAGKSYEMICLICGFKRAKIRTGYLDVAMKALDKAQRIKIGSVNLGDAVGRTLMESLTGIVELRNLHAQHASREVLPKPLEAIEYYTAQGIVY